MRSALPFDGSSCLSSAAAPLVMAALNDVPEPTKLAVPMRADGLLTSIVDPGTRRLTTERPAATRSGLNQPSMAVGPAALNVVMVSSTVGAVPLSSMAPAVMTSGSSPGEVIVPLFGPVLPADATTTMPAFQAASTARSSGLVTDDGKGGAPIEMLSTWMPSEPRFCTAHCTPAMTVARSVEPDAPEALIDTRLAPGASPMYAPPDDAPLPAIRPATKVPCP